MLRRVLMIAVIAGVTAGLTATLLQSVRLWPLIAVAEQFEQAGMPPHEHGADLAAPHGHDHEWEPEDGFERIAYTALFNVLVGFGCALLLNGALLLRGAVSGTLLDAQTGAMWGVAGFVSFALAPALGLPPELPGMAAADLLDRQVWWVATAFASAGGLSLMAFARKLPLKALGLIALAAPHIVAAPHIHDVGPVPAELAAEFVAASLVTAAVFWIVLGTASGWLHRRLA